MSLAALRRGDLAGATHLNLAGCGLCEWPPELSGLSETLEYLDLSGNPLTDLPAAMGRFQRLGVLFLSGTRISRLPPALGSCGSLSQIGLRGAGLEEIPAESLPPSLRWLSVTDNALETLPEALGHRPRLQKLLLSGNRLTSLPRSLEGADNLELLRLSANRLDRLPGWIGQMPRLAWLAWAGNGFDQRPHHDASTVSWARLAGGRPLGEGASGHVVAMRLLPEEKPVAVKLFKGRMTSDGLPEREIAAMLAAGAHPNLLPAFGRITGHPEGRDGLVLPLLPDGMRPLAAPPSLQTCTRDVYAADMRLSLTQLLAIVRGIAAAMAHLHTRGLSHGDLYAHNILWNGSATVLSDFGAASALPPQPQAQHLTRLESRAFGVLLGEGLNLCPQAADAAGLHSLADACTAPDVAARPAMAEILDALNAL